MYKHFLIAHVNLEKLLRNSSRRRYEVNKERNSYSIYVYPIGSSLSLSANVKRPQSERNKVDFNFLSIGIKLQPFQYPAYLLSISIFA